MEDGSGSVRSLRHEAGAIVMLLLSLAACVKEATPERRPATAQPAAAAAPTGARATAIVEAEDGQWTRPAKSYASLRYSGLDQINTTNVAKLQPAWTFETGVLRGQEAAPIVVNNTLYIVTPYPNILYALDLTRPGAPLKWKYEPKPDASAQGVACCDVVNRGAVYADGKVIITTLDDHVAAVDAGTGKEVWKTKVGNIDIGETMTMAPLVVHDKVLVGNSGGELGVRGWLTALDLATGKQAWRAYSTGPDSEVLIGQRFKSYYQSDSGKDLGVTTWQGDQWKIGGGNVWGWISYDPDLNLIYYGTGNPGPWNPDQRPGDNKWTSTIFARDPDTGEAVWAYQMTPHDMHDYDGVNEALLVDLPWKGAMRKVLLHPDRNGRMYVMDRATGELLSAEAYGHINTTLGVDMRSGRPQPNPLTKPVVGKVVRDICPASPGAKDWQPSAFSPRTGLLYIPHQNLCQDSESLEANYIAGTPYVGMNVRIHPGPGGNRGVFTAWDPVNARPAWEIKENFPVWSGALATAGDVVFYGTMEGWL